MTFLVTAATLAAGLGLLLVWHFNRLVRARNLVREGWSGIDVQLKRRADLIPPLVEVVKGYAAHERAAFERMTELRSASGAAASLPQRQQAENALSDQIRHLFVLVEAYPELRADRHFLDLQHRLAEIEDQIQHARRYYNGAVRDLNVAVESFPSNLVAAAAGFRTAEFFEIAGAADRQVPAVEIEP